MDRRTALRRISGISVLMLGGCGARSVKTGSTVSAEGTEKGSGGGAERTQQSAEPTFSINWTYDETEGNVVNTEAIGNSLYIRDTGRNLHRLNLENGRRKWYLSNVPETNRLVSLNETPVLVDSDPLRLHGYTTEGSQTFEIGPEQLYDVQQWSNLPIIDQLVVEGDKGIYIVGLVQDAPPPSCYVVEVGAESGSLSGGAAWHTAGLSDSFINNSGFVIGGWGHFPPYIEKISTGGHSVWATSVDIRNYVRIDSIQTDPSGSVYAEFRSEESAGIVALDSDGNIIWKHQLRGSPDQTFGILKRSIITADQIIVPYVPDRDRPTEVRLVALNKESGEKRNETVIKAESETRPFDPIAFNRVKISSWILIGFRQGSSPFWRVVELPELTQSGEVTIPKTPSDLVGAVSDSKFLYITSDSVSMVELE